MFRKLLMLMTVTLVFSASEVQADVIHSTWVGGEFGYWKDASNWSPPIVPDNSTDNTFIVTIDSNSIGVDEAFVVFVHSRTINQLDCKGFVDLDVWTPEPVWLYVSNGITNHGCLSADDLHIVGSFKNVTGASSVLDEISISENLINQTGATIEVEVVLEIDTNIINEGDIKIFPLSHLLVENDVQNIGNIYLNNSECWVDRIFDNNSTGLIQGSGIISAGHLRNGEISAGQLNNKGQIIAYGGSLAIASKGGLINEGVLGNFPPSSLHIKLATDVNNLGTIQVHAGGGVGIDCNLVNDRGAKIKLLGGTLGTKSIAQKAEAIFDGFGTITVLHDILIESGAKIKVTGPTNIVGNLNIPENARLEISDGTTLVTGHTTNNGIIHVVNGDVVFQGGYSGSGVVQKD